jgi:hypothetical protein
MQMRRAIFAAACLLVLACSPALARGGTNAHEMNGVRQSADPMPKPHWTCCPPC